MEPTIRNRDEQEAPSGPAVRAAIDVLLRAPLAELLGQLGVIVQTKPVVELVHQDDTDVLRDLGFTPRTFAERCRRGLIAGALRTATRGWTAPRANVLEQLARPAARSLRAKKTVVEVPAAVPANDPNDATAAARALLSAGSAQRGRR